MTKTIVMIHGMFGGSWCWDNMKLYFEGKDYQCHTPVLRHHEPDAKEKPHPDLGGVSLLDYAQDLENYIAELEEKPIIIGHSMGGLLAQILAARGLAQTLVLLSPAAPSGINALKFSVIKTFWDYSTRWRFWRKPYLLPFNNAVYSVMHLTPLEEQYASYQKYVHESGRAIAEIGFWAFDSKRAAKVDEAKVACPVLVVCGSEDRITPASTARKIADKYQRTSTYKQFDHHAHWLLGEPGWEKIAEFVYGWIMGVHPVGVL